MIDYHTEPYIDECLENVLGMLRKNGGLEHAEIFNRNEFIAICVMSIAFVWVDLARIERFGAL